MDCRRRVLSASSGAMRLWGESMSSQASMADGEPGGESQRAASGIDAWTKPLQPASRQLRPRGGWSGVGRVSSLRALTSLHLSSSDVTHVLRAGLADASVRFQERFVTGDHVHHAVSHVDLQHAVRVSAG